MVLSVAGAVALFVSMLVGGAPEPAGLGPPARAEPPPRGVPSAAPLDPSLAAKVVGGPPSMSPEEKVTLVETIERMWERIVDLLAREPNPEARAVWLAPLDRAVVGAMAPVERRRAVESNRLGILYSGVTGSPKTYDLIWVALEPGGTARVVRSSGGHAIAYSVRWQDGSWWPSIGPVERNWLDVEAARDGWIDPRFHGAGGPAGRVSGGPVAVSDLEREEAAHGLAWALRWSPIGERVAPELTEAEGDLALYHVRLDETGQSGRLVAATDARTIAVSIRREGGEWRLGDPSDGDFETRNGPPVPEDRDGWLGR
jgi:hypothetical protein